MLFISGLFLFAPLDESKVIYSVIGACVSLFVYEMLRYMCCDK